MTAWQPPPAEPALAAGDVHVWRIALDPPADAIAALARTLSDDEHGRAARFHFDRDRVAFTVARGALRTLAGRYLDEPPARLAFGYRERGKPYLTAPPGAPGLRFNLSHSGQRALVCFACDRELGVDIELRRELSDLRSLARTAFSPAEYAALCRLPPDAQPHAFFTCWSRKEAVIKATGEGVAQLAAFDVSLAPGEPARLLRFDGEPPDAPRWSLHDLPAIPGYAAALAVERAPGAAPRITCWDWAPHALPH